VYKDGQKYKLERDDVTGKVTWRGDGGGRKAVSNWDGKNLDPEAVQRHRQQLRRAGFENNAHAKGFF